MGSLWSNFILVPCRLKYQPSGGACNIVESSLVPCRLKYIQRGGWVYNSGKYFRVHVDQNTKVRGGWCKRLSGTKIHNGYQKYLRLKWSIQTASKDMCVHVYDLNLSSC